MGVGRIATLLLLVAVLLQGETEARRSVFKRSFSWEARLSGDVAMGSDSSARHARHLVHANVWATMSTISVQFHGIPYGNIVSFSDGIGSAPEASTGKLFFYLTSMDPTATDLAANPNATVTISKAQEGPCTMDVEDPTCWRLTLVGSVAPVDTANVEYAEKVLFSKHPEMKWWPKNHGFAPYVLTLEHIVLLDFYGGAKHVPVAEYYAIKL